MKFCIRGAGVSGATLARILAERGHDVVVLEKAAEFGGLCMSKTHAESGQLYEPFGNHYFHTNIREVFDFLSCFTSWGEYRHRKGIEIKGNLYPYPITKHDAWDLTLGYKTLGDSRNTNDLSLCAAHKFGYILFKLFIENYSKTMWGPFYELMDPEEILKRIPLVDHAGLTFPDIYQGVPLLGYTGMIKKMLDHQNIRSFLQNSADSDDLDSNRYDVVIHTGSLAGQDALPYRSMQFQEKLCHSYSWPNKTYGVINLPDHGVAVRKCNFNVIHDNVDQPRHLIQYHFPCTPSAQDVPMYPVTSKIFEPMYQSVLRVVVRSNVCPAGRLGLYKYLNIDQAVHSSMMLAPIVEQFPKMSVDTRVERINAVRRSV